MTYSYGDDEELSERLRAYVRQAVIAPTVAEVALLLEVPPLRVAELVGQAYHMLLTGDLSDPEKTAIEEDGE